ncbi:MAG: ribonuclease III [Ignavibacteriaceae bacterium]
MTDIFSKLFKRVKYKNPSVVADCIKEKFTPEKFRELENIIGEPIIDKTHFLQALVHRSFLEQNNDFEASNERLEFLGDAILNLIVADYLFHKFPYEEEGFLTKVRAKIVNRNTLGEVGEKLNLSSFILVGRNLSKSVVSSSKSIVSDAVEALIGAIYLDSGMKACTRFVNKFLVEPIVKEGGYLVDENYKSQLLEYAQGRKLKVPTYRVVKEEGPQHDRIFTVEVLVGSKMLGIGKGKNKKNSEQNAAKSALKEIRSLNINSD